MRVLVCRVCPRGQVLGLNDRNTQLETQLDETRSGNASRQLALEATQREKALLVQHTETLERELQHKLELLSTGRQERSTEVLDLQAQLQAALASASSAQAQLTVAQARLTKKDQELEACQLELRDATALHAKQRESDSREVTAQTRLSELYQRGMTEERARVQVLQQSIQTLEESLARQNAIMQESQHAASEQLSAVTGELAEKQALLEQCEQELAQARQQCQAAEARTRVYDGFEAAGSAEVAAQRHLQPPADMSPIELYSNYVNATSCLRLERAETKRLKSTLDHLDHMIQERSVAIQQEREEAAMIKSSHQSLEHKHSEAVQRCKELQDEIGNLQRKLSTGDFRLKKLTQENDDLSNQVRELLYRDVRMGHVNILMRLLVCVGLCQWRETKGE